MQLRNRYIIWFLLDLVLIGVWVLGAWFIEGEYAHVVESGQVLAELTDARQHATGLTQSVQASTVERAKLESYFVTKDSAATFIQKLESLATRSGVKFSLQNIDTSTTLGLQAEVSGSFANVYHFLSLIEQLPYATSFTGVTFDHPTALTEKSPSDWVATINWSVDSYKP